MRYAHQKKREDATAREEFVTLAGIVADVRPASIQMHHDGSMYWLPRSLVKFGDAVRRGDAGVQVRRWKASQDKLALEE